MKKHIIFLFAALAMLMCTGCNYEELNTNQFEMTDEEGVMDGIAVGGLITTMQQSVLPVGTQADDTDIINQYQIAYHLSADTWSGYFGQNNSWNAGNNNTSYYLQDAWISSTYSSSYTSVLDSWKKLKANAEANNTPEVFALAQILKISAWHKTLECFGPIPYLNADAATLNIPFDSERDVYNAIFEELSDAISVLTQKAENGISVMSAYDAVYAGDTRKWVKYANSLMLRLALRVRFADNDLAKQYAIQAVNHSIGVMTDKGDEAQMSVGAGMVYRNNIEWLSEQYNETRMGSSMFSYLTGYQDPRLSAYFKPVDEGCEYGVTAFDGKAYQAVPQGHTYGQNSTYQSFSKPNIQSSTPTYWLRASEVYFLRAEAALAWGSIFGSDSKLYQQGIEMSFQENGITASASSYINSGLTPAAHSVDGRYSCNYQAPTAATVAYSGTSEQKLEKIMIQKWIALYPNGQEAWTEWRRTGYPKLNPVLTNRGSSFGVTSASKGVRRMVYPQSFYLSTEGQAIYNEALKLFNNGNGGSDLASTRLWWDCK